MNSDRDGPAGPGPTAATTGHANRAMTSPAASVAIGPPRAEALDPTRPVTYRAPGSPHHGGRLHHLLHQNRPSQHAHSHRRYLRYCNWIHSSMISLLCDNTTHLLVFMERLKTSRRH